MKLYIPPLMKMLQEFLIQTLLPPRLSTKKSPNLASAINSLQEVQVPQTTEAVFESQGNFERSYLPPRTKKSARKDKLSMDPVVLKMQSRKHRYSLAP